MKTKTQPDVLKNLASGEATEAQLAPADFKTLQEFGQGLDRCFASLNGLSEPFASQFKKIKTDINTALASLAPTDQVSAALRADDTVRQLLWMFQRAQEVIDGLGKVASGARDTAMASLTAEVDSKIKAQITAGELVTKADHEQRIGDAVAAAKSGASAELKRIGDRRTLLASAKLPCPSDELLAGEDADFTVRKTKAEGRLEKLKPFTALPEDRRLTLAWGVDDAKFNETLGFMQAVQPGTPSPAPAKSGVSGFIFPVPTPEAKPGTLTHKRVGVL